MSGVLDPPDRAVANYRYTLPATPTAAATVDIGQVAVTIELFLSGTLDVAAHSDGQDPRPDVLTTLRDLAKGLMVRGLGSPTPGIAAAAGHAFTQRRYEFRAPNTIVFTGDVAVDFTRAHPGTNVAVTGAASYSLEVTAAGGSPTSPRGWFGRHEKELASIGMVVLVAVPVAPAGLVARDG